MIYAIRIVRTDPGRENTMELPWRMQVQRAWFKYDGLTFECGLHPWEDVPVITEPPPEPDEEPPADQSYGGSS